MKILLIFIENYELSSMMAFPYRSNFFHNLAADFKDFVRNPGLLATTAAATIFLFLFIVFPIGAVLLKSFTIAFPTVTISSENKVSNRSDSETLVTQPILVALGPIEGIEEIRSTTKETTSVVVLRFRKDWDTLRGLNDSKKALKLIQETLDPFVKNIEVKLGRETVKSLATYAEFFSQSYYYRALRNSLILSIVTTTCIIFIAFIFAYLSLNGPNFVKTPVRILSLLPLIAPPFIFSLSLILIGGRRGILAKLFDFPYNIYGWPGVIIAQVITFLPLGYLMIENTLRSLNPSLDDAASDMGASGVDILLKITIPLAAPGILKAALLVFIVSLADFANPLLIGGGLSLLATDAYLLWVGEGNLEMASVFCMLLIIPSLIVFIFHHYVLRGKMYTTIEGKPQQAEKRKIPPTILYPMISVAFLISFAIVVCFGIIFLTAFTKVFTINNTFTMEHFSTPYGLRALMTSLEFSLSAALIAPIIGVTLSYMLIRKRIPLKGILEFLALLGFAVPGTVMGVGYILFFNSPPLKLTGTFIILIINEAFRNLSVSLEAGVSKLHQVDIAIEEAATDMGANTLQTFTKIVLPLISSAFLAGFIFTFMVGMIAVSAVIFLITPGKNLASLYILQLAELGNTGIASALCVMLIIAVTLCLGALKLLSKYAKISIY